MSFKMVTSCVCEMVTNCIIYKCSDNYKKYCKGGYFRLPGVRKDADNKTLELSKERRRVWLRRIIGQVIICQKLNLQKWTQQFVFVASILLMVGAAMSISNFYSIKITYFYLVNRLKHSTTLTHCISLLLQVRYNIAN